MQTRISASPRLVPALAVLCLAVAPAAAHASSFTDAQANNAQVEGEPSSNTTAVFPTNKQNEPSIAVDPTNSSLVLAGSNDEQRQPACGATPPRAPDPKTGLPILSDCSFFPGVGTDGIYISKDGGTSWANHGLLDDQESWKASPYVSDGDPVIVFGPKPDPAAHRGFSYEHGARAYYVGLGSYKPDYPSGYSSFKAPEFILVSSSDDGGQTWSAPVRATTKDNPNTFNDKNSAWADNNPASPNFGNVYVGFTAFRSFTFTGYGNEPVEVSHSTDGGSSFSAPNQVSAAGNNGTGNGRQGSDIVTGPDGTVYVAFEQGSSQVVVISRDGGVSYSRPITMGPVSDLADPIPGSNFRTNSFPSIAADERDGKTTAYASWATRTADGGRIVVVKSTDRGRTWSDPVRVSGSEGYAFFNGMDVAPDGRVDIAYQAQTAINPATFGTGNATINSWYVHSDGSPSGYSAPQKVTSAGSDPAATAQNNLMRQFWGDYNTLVSTATGALFIYTDSRTGTGCQAVDEYQQPLAAAGTAEPEERERRTTGKDAGTDPAKPAPPIACDSQFGNSDAYVSVITP
jgi:hypothetical protein